MTASVTWRETNGAAATPTVTTATNLNFGSTDAPNITTTSYPIRNGNNSYEKYFKIGFTGDGTTSYCDNVKYYKSAGTLPTGVSIVGAATATYATPVATASTVATAAVPTGSGTALTLDTQVALTNGTMVVTDNYGVLQMQTTTSAGAGRVPASGSITFTVQWDEY